MKLRYGNAHQVLHRKPSVPFAKQEKGQAIQVPSAHSKNLNVLGFINHNCQFQSDVFEETINSDVVVAVFDEFAKIINKPTYVLIVHAPTHTSGLIDDQIEQWKESNLFVKFLSSYSPDLNIIEILLKKLNMIGYLFRLFNLLRIDNRIYFIFYKIWHR